MELPTKLIMSIEQFSKLPGVGLRTATRQSLFLSRLNNDEIKAFGESIKMLSELRTCEVCGLYADDKECVICHDFSREQSSTICVIENMTDCIAIENSGEFSGQYHVLGGVLNPLMGVGPGELHIDKLLARVRSKKTKTLILALNPSVEGDATCSYIVDLVGTGVSIRRIGFGVPVGGSLEFLDSMTISKALENSKLMN